MPSLTELMVAQFTAQIYMSLIVFIIFFILLSICWHKFSAWYYDGITRKKSNNIYNNVIYGGIIILYVVNILYYIYYTSYIVIHSMIQNLNVVL